MPMKWRSILMMSLLIVAAISCGCRAPYPTYNPYGFYGQPCVNPPGTGGYNPATGRTDPYYGAPANGVYPPNPYGQYPNQGYPPQQQPVGGNTSQRTWSPQASADPTQGPTVEAATSRSQSLIASTEGQWQSVDNPNRNTEPAQLDTTAAFTSTTPSVAANSISRFDGFGRD